MFFYGQWGRYLIDDAGRVTVPTVFRRVLGREVILVEDSPTTLSVYPQKPRFLKRFKPERIWLLKIDARSRILVPGLRRGFWERQITWLGKGDHLEIQIQKSSLKKSKMRA